MTVSEARPGARTARLPRDERRAQLLQAAQEVFVANGVGPILMLYGGQNLHAAIANDYWNDTLYAGCVIGQYGPDSGGYTSLTSPTLATGGCLIGQTRSIDW